MDSPRNDVWFARAGLVLGLALAAVAVAGWTMPAGDPQGGARITLTAVPTGELGVAPLRPVLRSRPLHAGESVRGAVVITNLTGETRRVQARAATPSHELDGNVHLLATSDAGELFAGPLGSARAWGNAVELPAGARIRVHVELSLLPGAADYEDRTADLRLELRSEATR